MANRRFAVYEIRNVIARMRLGETDRQISRAGLMGRNKAAVLRRLAIEHGWLNKDVAMPSNETIAAAMAPSTTPIYTSSIDPYAEQVLAWARCGVTGVAIHQGLVRNFEFTGAYSSVKRFLQRHCKAEPATTVILDFKPGEAAQLDFGAGPQLINWENGEVVKTWFFVMTLAFSRHQYVEFVLDQKVETWLGCHRRAFEFFGGVPTKLIIDNPKCAITKACYYDPEVQRAYADCAEGYGFLISPCPVADPAKKA